MTKAPQAACIQLGATGCYFFSILYHAETILGKQIEPLAAFAAGIRRGVIDSEAYVKDAGGLMSDLTGQKWEAFKAGPGHELPLDYQLQPGEIEILRYEKMNPRPGKESAHFVVGDGEGHAFFDPMGLSVTVAQGFLASRRIFRRVK